MAALNISTFHGQLFWLIVSFSLFYIIFVIIIVPNIYMISKVRNLLINKLVESGDRSLANKEINIISKASMVEYLRYFISTKLISNLAYLRAFSSSSFSGDALGVNVINKMDIKTTKVTKRVKMNKAIDKLVDKNMKNQLTNSNSIYLGISN